MWAQKAILMDSTVATAHLTPIEDPVEAVRRLRTCTAKLDVEEGAFCTALTGDDEDRSWRFVMLDELSGCDMCGMPACRWCEYICKECGKFSCDECGCACNGADYCGDRM